MSARDFLLEIGTEEIPAGYMQWVLPEIRRVAEEALDRARLSHGGVSSMGTPRRIVLSVRDLEEHQNDLTEEFKGPAWNRAFDSSGNPTKAAAGFARSKGVTVDDLQMRSVEGVEYAFAVVRAEGRPTTEVLPELLPDIIGKLVFPKNMYWKDTSIRFARPIRWLLSLWGDEVVPFSYGHLESGRTTRGHRFMGARSLEISNASEYLDRLYDQYVIVDPDKRREMMLCRIASIEKDLQGKVELDPDLVEENLFLVEFPVPFFGSFEEAFLDIPDEVLTTSMKVHQRYFPVRDSQGNLKNFFVGVSNNRATNMDVVRDGNERVLRARLADAAFFWTEDQKKPLQSRVDELKSIVYQEQVGTVYEKMERARELASWLCDHLELAEEKKFADRAAFLYKSDLVTNMVYEFPELQGVMGREYAKKNGEPDRVALAIYEQYLPRFAGDELPSDVIGAIVGMADRIDTMVACTKAGLEPTGSQDPYGFRRAARTINEILWGLELDVDLEALVRQAASGVGAGEDVVDKVVTFLKNRLQIQLKEKGFSHESVSLALSAIWNRPFQAMALVQVLSGVQEESWFQGLITAAVRVRNILAKAEELPQEGIKVELMVQPEEKALLETVKDLGPVARDARDRNDWKEAVQILSRLEPVIASFFDEVLVNAEEEDIRQNRLALLASCQEMFRLVGDLGMLK